jgi:hypothetical protein
MNAAYAISRLDWAIGRYGQTVTLQRMAVDPATGALTVGSEVTCPAAVRPYGPQDLEAGEVVDIRVVVSPTGLAGFEPKRDDRIVINGDPANVVQVERLYHDGGTLCRVNMLCRG